MELRTRSQELYEAGIRTLDILDEQFAHFRLWADALFDADASYATTDSDPFEDAMPPPKGPEFLDRQVEVPAVGTITILELLTRTGAHYMVKDVIKSKDFAI